MSVTKEQVGRHAPPSGATPTMAPLPPATTRCWGSKPVGEPQGGVLRELTTFMAEHSEDLDDDGVILLNAGEDLTWAQVPPTLKICMELIGRDVGEVSAELSVREQRLRGTLRLIAEATDGE